MNRPDTVLRVTSRRRAILRYMACGVLLTLIVLNMTVIFLFSAEDPEASGERSENVTQQIVQSVVKDYDQLPPAEQQSKIDAFQFPIRKLAHLTEYALLGFLCGAFLHTLGKGAYWMYWSFPAALCLLYAISDEVHQIFSDRGASPLDVLLDFAGSLLGLCIIHGCVGLVRRIRKQREKARVCKSPTTT